MLGWEASRLDRLTEVEEVLIRFASRLRAQSISYSIKYGTGSGSPFKLRYRVGELNRQLFRRINLIGDLSFVEVTVGDMDQTTFAGAVKELELICRAVMNKDRSGQIDVVLNVLKAAPFKREVEAEYLRVVEYDLKFVLVRLDIVPKMDWRVVVKDVKHTTRMLDKIGLLRTDRIAVIYPVKSFQTDHGTKVQQRLKKRFSPETVSFDSLNVSKAIKTVEKLNDFLTGTAVAEG